MKNLLIVRHTKAINHHEDKKDEKRELRPERIQDAHLIANRTIRFGFIADLVISSPAKRALDTAKIFCDHWGIDYKYIKVVDKFYLQTLSSGTNYLKKLDNQYSNVAVFGHNPTHTELIGFLEHKEVSLLPTTGACLLTMLADNWADLEEEEWVRKFLFYPRMFRKKSDPETLNIALDS